jgi:general secretion pathway protein A
MYFNYYGLKEKPFSLSADPKYLFYSQNHKEALAQMIYAASEDSGFFVLSGEVGTGKTMMVNALLDRLPNDYRVAKIYHTALNPKGLIQNICKEFGLEYLNISTSQLILKIQDFLKWTRNAGEKSLLILDEAQDLNMETLEEVRLISNFEFKHKRILQIFLVGQQELESKLANPHMRQFRDRISLRYKLTKLTREETYRYIGHRLAIAGRQNNKAIFTKEAIDEIHHLSGGIPRRINVIGENALLMGYSENNPVIKGNLIKHVADYRPAGESFTDLVEKELHLPTFGTPMINTTSPNPMVNSYKVSTPPANPVQTAASMTASHDPVTTADIPDSHVTTERRRTMPPRRATELPSSPPIIRTDPEENGGNGPFDPDYFQSMMDEYLDANSFEVVKRKSTGSKIFKGVMAFVTMVMSFLLAIYIAMELGIINFKI